MKSFNKILIINPFGIGDVLFTTPLIRAIKEALPDARVSYWCNRRVKDILADNPRLEKIFAFSRGDLKKIWRASKVEWLKKFIGLLNGLKKEKFDLAIDFSLDHRYGLAAKAVGIKKRIGFDYKRRGRFLTDKIEIDGFSHRHMVEWYLDLLKFLQIQPIDRRMEVFVPDSEKALAQEMFSRAGIGANDLVIGVACGGGSSWGKDAALKQWPAERFAQLIDRLCVDLGARVVLLGDSADRDSADIIKATAKSNFLDLVGKTGLQRLAAAVANLKLIVANDGGPMHMAVALGIKTVAIFGPVDDLVYGPYPAQADHIVVKNDVGCNPCYKNFRLALCRKNKECINAVKVEDVFSAVRRLL